MSESYYLNPLYRQGSATLALDTQVKALQAAGHEIRNLGVGELAFDAPAHIQRALHEAIDAGKTRYTAVKGAPDLLDAIRAKFERDYRLTYTRDQVIASTGLKQGIDNLFAVALRPGDVVLIPTPCWVGYEPVVNKYGGVCQFIPCSSENDYKLTAEQLKQAITPETQWLILNSPGNPTGSVYTREELEGIAQVLRDNPHVRIFLDDIYEKLLFDGHEFCSLLTVAPDLMDRVVVGNGISKAYALTGLRLGFVAGSKETIGAMSNHQSIVTSNPCSLSQWGAIAALNGDHSFLQQDWVPELQERRDVLVEGLNAIDGFSAKTPAGSFYVPVNCSGWINRVTPDNNLLTDDTKVAEYLLHEAGVAVMFGSAFRWGEPALRWSVNLGQDDLKRACELVDVAGRRLVAR